MVIYIPACYIICKDFYFFMYRLTNLKNLNESRRRSDSKRNKTESNSKKDARPKSKLFAGEEGLLEVLSSSDELSASENDAGDEGK